jgi:hypothetical protein
VDVDRLEQALHHWLPRASRKSLAVDSIPASSEDEESSLIVDEVQMRSCLTGEEVLDVDLVQMAVQQLHEALDRMTVALKEGADAEWRQASHRARGTCGTMGFAQTAALLQVAEFEATSAAARRRVLDELQQAVLLLIERLAELKFPMPTATTV